MASLLARWITVAAATAAALFPTSVTSKQTSYPGHRCASAAPAQSGYNLTSTTLYVGQLPWGLAYLNESIAFAAVNFSIAVINTTELQPTLITSITIGPDLTMGNYYNDNDGYGFRELKLSNSGQNLYIATGYGALILDVERTIQGRNDSVVGRLSNNGYVGQSAIDLSVSADDEYVFISQEFGSNVTYNRGAVEVFNVQRQDNGTVTSTWKGFIILGYGTISQAFSPDHTKLFVTSELNKTSRAANYTEGIVSVLDLAKLRTTPGKAFIANITSGCRPVRCQMSADKKHLWVTQRDSNSLSVFDATLLQDNITTPNALLATVNTGTSPIGLAVVGNTVLTADSNRFNYTNATAGITVVSSPQAIRQAVTDFPQLQMDWWSWPRTLLLSPSGNRLLVSEYGSGFVRVVDVSSLNTASLDADSPDVGARHVDARHVGARDVDILDVGFKY